MTPTQYHGKVRKQTKNLENNKAKSKGLIIAKNHVETLEALLKSYEARQKPQEILQELRKRYLDPKHESWELEIYK